MDQFGQGSDGKEAEAIGRAPACFVIQHHRTRDGEHWDLMLEVGPALKTWQLWRNPATIGEGPIAATRIGDHRKAYLTYEGPIDGDRGAVQIFDRGRFGPIELGTDRAVFSLKGEQIHGQFALTRCGAGSVRWEFARIISCGESGGDDRSQGQEPPDTPESSG